MHRRRIARANIDSLGQIINRFLNSLVIPRCKSIKQFEIASIPTMRTKLVVNFVQSCLIGATDAFNKSCITKHETNLAPSRIRLLSDRFASSRRTNLELGRDIRHTLQWR